MTCHILPHRRLWIRTGACGALLLSNLPVAAGLVVAANAIDSCYAVEIRNESGTTLEDVRVTGPGCGASFGTLRPGTASSRWLWARGEGSLMLEIGGKEAKMVEGYVCSGMGGQATATVRPDGTVAVQHSR